MLRRRIQEETAVDWTDDELNVFLNLGYQLVAKQIRKVDPTFLVYWESRDIVSGTQWYEKPENSRGIIDVGIVVGTDIQYLRRVSGNVAKEWNTDGETVYTLMGDFIGLFPSPTTDVTNGLKLIHAPTPSLSEDTDVPKTEPTLHYAIVCWASLLIKGESLEDDSKDSTTLRQLLVDIPEDYGQKDFSQPPYMSPDVSDARGKYGSQLDNDVDVGRN